METGLGIAIAGIWLFPCACAVSKNITSGGLYMAIFVASTVTFFLV